MWYVFCDYINTNRKVLGDADSDKHKLKEMLPTWKSHLFLLRDSYK